MTLHFALALIIYSRRVTRATYSRGPGEVTVVAAVAATAARDNNNESSVKLFCPLNTINSTRMQISRVTLARRAAPPGTDQIDYS